MKRFYSLILLLLFAANGYSQVQSKVFKDIRKDNISTSNLDLSPIVIDGSASHKKSASSSTHTNNYITTFSQVDTSVIVHYSESSNLPLFIERVSSLKKSAVSDTASCFRFLRDVSSYTKIAEPEENFFISSIHHDKLNNTHVRFHQKYKGVAVYGSDFYVHLKKHREQFTGNYHHIDSDLNVQPQITDIRAVELVLGDLKTRTKVKQFNEKQKDLLDYSEPETKLVLKQVNGMINSYRLVYHVSVRPNFSEEWIYFVDAKTGSITDSYNSTKNDGITTATAYDLNDVQRTINTYLLDGVYFMVNGAEPMFDIDRDEGYIETIDAQNTPDNIIPVTSLNNTWDNRAAVSAHYYATKAYRYFHTTYGRNSINAQGCDITCIVNVGDEDGNGYDNATWNGRFVTLGNGGEMFYNLAGAEDVVAHEIGHGVTENTANFEYYGQSGAIDETYADIFGAMVDRDDWLIGENVTKLSFSPNGVMRDMSNPHNNGIQGNSYWQPMHISEMYIGNEDNGGVHINSGIGNYAFYLYATALSKETAEQVFYHALKNYLTSTSQFIDFRIAVVQSAGDLFGEDSEQVLRAEIAFDAVGIYDEQGNNYLQDYTANEGDQHLCYYDLDPSHPSTFYTSDIVGDNAVGLTNYYANSRLSITDDGTAGVYVSSNNTIHAIDITTAEDFVIQDQQIWANAVISKDGNRLAAVTTVSDTSIWVYDFNQEEWARFNLYNPTTSHSLDNSNGVVFADALEFDVTGEYLVYDAYNLIAIDSGTDSIAYWDIGFINVWDNQSNMFGDGTIMKLYGTLPKNTSIGNPTFSKNSPYVLAFDYYDEIDDRLAIFGTNIATGVTDLIALNNEIGYPSYTKDDDVLVFTGLDGDVPVVKGVILESNKISTSVSNNPVTLITNAMWGVCFADGVRDLGLSPIANFTASYKSGIAPLEVQFFDNSVNDPISWNWAFEGGTPATSTEQNPIVSYPNEGEFEVTLLVENNFGENTITKNSYINVVANSLTINTNELTISNEVNSTASFEITSNTDWTITGLESWLSANETTGKGNATITLTAEDNPSSESRTATLSISGTGVSSQSITVTQTGVTGMTDNYIGEINIYPNPAISILKIVGLHRKATGHIYNANGQMIFSNEIGAKNGEINVSELPSGLYILKMDVDEDVVVKRFMKK